MDESKGKRRNIPTVLQQYFECPECSKNVRYSQDPVVLTCGHSLCLQCLEKRLGLSPKPDRVDCPACKRWVHIPHGRPRALHRGGFSRVAFRTLTESKFHYSPDGLDLKCGLHPDRDSTGYCPVCQVPVCAKCVTAHHLGHAQRVENLGDVAEVLEEELLALLEDKSQEVEKALLIAKAQWGAMESHVVNLEQEINARAQEFHKEIDKMKEDNLKKVHKFQRKQTRLFEEGTTSLEMLKLNLLHFQKFVDVLREKGKDQDKTAYCPGLQDVIQMQCRGPLIGAPTWHYKIDFKAASKTAKPDLEKSFGKFSARNKVLENFSFLRIVDWGLSKCPGASFVKYTSIFGKETLMHVIEKSGNILHDKLMGKVCALCVHRDHSVKRVELPKMSCRGAMAVVDPSFGTIVVADTGKKTAHREGSLHWITLSRNLAIVQTDATDLECEPCGEINVDGRGEVLVLTRCATAKHPSALHIFDQYTRARLRTVFVSGGMLHPQSAVQSANDEYAVVGDGKVVWLDFDGKLLREFSKATASPYHVIRHSQGYLLISDTNNKLCLMTRDGESLETIDIQRGKAESNPALYLDEQSGLLAVSWNRSTVHVYHFTPRQSGVLPRNVVK